MNLAQPFLDPQQGFRLGNPARLHLSVTPPISGRQPLFSFRAASRAGGSLNQLRDRPEFLRFGGSGKLE
jgi:hypothetical protein